MDIQIASRLLFDWFDNHDSYNNSTDYKKLNWSKIEEDKNSSEREQQAAILAALSILEEDKFVYCVELDRDLKPAGIEYVWVLLRSQKNSEVSISFSKETASKIAHLVNSILPMIDINITETSNPKSLGEADLLVILQGFNVLSEKLSSYIDKKEKKN